MSKIVKYTEFKSVVDALWGKVKNNFVTITKASQYVSKFKPNVISEKTLIVDGYIQGNKVSSVNNEPSPRHHMNIGGWFIYERFKVAANTKVSHITIGVDDTLNVGDMVRGVVVGFAKQIAFDRVRVEKYVMQDGVAFVRNNTDTSLTNCTKVVTIEVNDTVTEDMLLVLGCEKAIWGEKDAQTTGLSAGGGLPLVQVGEERPIGYGNWVGKAVVYADGISLKDMSNNITTNSNEIQSVRTELNNKIDITQIGTANGNIPQIGVDGRLDTSIMPDIAITSVEHANSDQEMMNKNVQVGDIIVAGHEGNATYMCKDANAQNKNDKFIKINMGYPVVKDINGHTPDPTGAITINGTQINVDGQVTSPTIAEEFKKYVKSVNGETPRADGSVTIYARQISGTYNQNGGTVQAHLDTIKNNIDNASNRIATLERKVPPIRVGELIQTFAYNGDSYSQGGVEYVWLGKQNNLIQRAKYPALFDAFGLASGTNAFNLPHIADQSVQFDYGRSRYRKTYIVAKIS